jgi:hypothetical protein
MIRATDISVPPASQADESYPLTGSIVTVFGCFFRHRDRRQKWDHRGSSTDNDATDAEMERVRGCGEYGDKPTLQP